MAIRSPLRGAQGNALKTIVGIPVALMGEGNITIESHSIKHNITASLDPAGNPRIEHESEYSCREKGTSIMISIPQSSRNPLWWVATYAMLNPHVSFYYNQGRENEKVFPALGKVKKYVSTDPTSPHWYTFAEMERLIFGYINHTENGGKDFTLREFLSTFKGLSGGKVKKITDCIDVKYVSQLKDNPEMVKRLFNMMIELTTTPKPDSLGIVGQEHMSKRLQEVCGAEKVDYKKIKGFVGNIPFVVEAAFGFSEQGGVFYGTNFSPSYKDPTGNYSLKASLGKDEFQGLGVRGFLLNTRMHYEHFANSPVSTAIAMHIIYPAFTYRDKGKTEFVLPDEVVEAVQKAVWDVIKDPLKKSIKEDRSAAREERKREQEQKKQEQKKMGLKTAVFTVMDEAVKKASGDGKYPYSARSVFYQVRPLIQHLTSKTLHDTYFCDTLIYQYMQEVKSLPGLYREPRGHLREPHTDKEVPMGTREVEGYYLPELLFNKILYVEKEGLMPVLVASGIAEKYDMALVTGSGYSNNAIKSLLHLVNKQEKITICCLHDCDLDGYEIARTLQEGTRFNPGYEITIVDFGLFIEDGLDMGLEKERLIMKKKLSQKLWDRLDEEQRKFFVNDVSYSGRGEKYSGWRFELNALTPEQLIQYIEQNLEKHGLTEKVIPEEDKISERIANAAETSFREKIIEEIQSSVDLEKIADKIAEQYELETAGAFHEIVQDLKENDLKGWMNLSDKAGENIAEEVFDNNKQDIGKNIKTLIQEVLSDGWS